MANNNEIFLAPRVYIKFKEDADQYQELIDKLEPNTISLLEGFLHKVNDDINEGINLWDNIDRYIEEFKLDKLFPSKVLFQLKNPNFLKILINLKGTKNLLKWALNIFSIDIDFISNPTMFLEDNTLDREYIRNKEEVGECELISKVYINIDTLNYSNEEIFKLQEILVDLRQYLLYVCIYFGVIYLYITGEDIFKTLEKLLEELHTEIYQTDLDNLAHLYGELNCDWFFYTTSGKKYGTGLKYGGNVTNVIYYFGQDGVKYTKVDNKKVYFGWNKKSYGLCASVPHNDVKCCEGLYPYIFDFCMQKILQSDLDFYNTLTRVTEELHTIIKQRIDETYEFERSEELHTTLKISYVEDLRKWYKVNCDNNSNNDDPTKYKGAKYNDSTKYKHKEAVYGYCEDDTPYLVDEFDIEISFLFTDVYNKNKTGVLVVQLSQLLEDIYNFGKSETLKEELTSIYRDIYYFNKLETLEVTQYDKTPAKFGEGVKYNGTYKQDKFYDPIEYNTGFNKLKYDRIVFRKTGTTTV